MVTNTLYSTINRGKTLNEQRLSVFAGSCHRNNRSLIFCRHFSQFWRKMLRPRHHVHFTPKGVRQQMNLG